MKQKMWKWWLKSYPCKVLRKWLHHRIERNNKKVEKEWEDFNFLIDLCIENRNLDLDKYNRLMKMVKRKYKK